MLKCNNFTCQDFGTENKVFIVKDWIINTILALGKANLSLKKENTYLIIFFIYFK